MEGLTSAAAHGHNRLLHDTLRSLDSPDDTRLWIVANLCLLTHAFSLMERASKLGKDKKDWRVECSAMIGEHHRPFTPSENTLYYLLFGQAELKSLLTHSRTR